MDWPSPEAAPLTASIFAASSEVQLSSSYLKHERLLLLARTAVVGVFFGSLRWFGAPVEGRRDFRHETVTLPDLTSLRIKLIFFFFKSFWRGPGGDLDLAINRDGSGERDWISTFAGS